MASLQPVSGTLGFKRAKHLLFRATYGPSHESIDSFASKTVDQAINDLFQFPELPNPVGTSGGINGDGSVAATNKEITSWWIYQSLDPNFNDTVFFKLVFFLHTCLTTSDSESITSTEWYYYLRLLIDYTDKSYQELVKKMSFDNCMGFYLDISENTKFNPNENYARELLELFTLGKGPTIGPGNYTNYTEDDIKAATRVLTGFRRYLGNYGDPSRKDPETGYPRLVPEDWAHDTDPKVFSTAFQGRTIQAGSGAEGMRNEVYELIDLIFDQEAVAQFICTKLYRYFVNYRINSDIEQNIITPLAQIFRSSGYQFRPVLEALFKSQHFYDEDDSSNGDNTIGALIKSPFELYSHSLRFFKAYIPPYFSDLNGILNQWIQQNFKQDLINMGMSLFFPPSVAGYVAMYQEPDFNRYWISSNTLAYRFDILAKKILSESINTLEYGKFDILDYVMDANNVPPFQGQDPLGNSGPHEGPRIADHLVKSIVDYLFPIELDADRFDYFKNLLLDDLSEINWMFEWDNFRTTGNAENIRPQLIKLFRGIIQSLEFQLS